MFYGDGKVGDGKVKRYGINKEFMSCCLHKGVRTSICFTITVQVKI